MIHHTRRNLPHWQQSAATYFVTFSLGSGELQPQERQLVMDACLFWNEQRWTVEAVVVMSTHVHILARPLPLADGTAQDVPGGPPGYHSLSKIMQGIKGYTARTLNLGRDSRGPLWVQESYDRITRNSRDFEIKLRYMANNPVRAGLCKDYLEYPYFWYREETVPECRECVGYQICARGGVSHTEAWAL